MQGEARVVMTMVDWTGASARALRLARRMSIRAYAEHLGFNKSSVVNWERRGDQIRLRPETQQILDADLAGAPREVQQHFTELIGNQGQNDATVPATVGPATGTTHGPSDEPSRQTYEGRALNRRAATRGIAGAMIGAAMACSAVNLIARSAGDLPGVLLGCPAADAEPMSVANLTRQVRKAWRLRQGASYQALGELLPPLIAHAQTRWASEGDVSDAAGRALVHAYNTASSLLRRLGDQPLALVAADRAVSTAQAVGDPVLVAAALYRLANVLLGAGRSVEARMVALRAANLVEPGKARTVRGLAVWGGLLLTAAVCAARDAQEALAWELLGEARAASLLVGGDYADMYSIFGPTNLAIHGVQVAVELHNGADAVRRAAVIDPDRLPASLLERRCQLFIDTAHGHALQGADGEAEALLLHADDIAPQEVRLNPDAHQLTRTLLGRKRTAVAPGLRDLARRLGLDN